MKEFLRESVIYRQFSGDSGCDAVYTDYRLDGVLVREIFAVDPDMTEDGTTILYFFPGKSRCTDTGGGVCGMPYPKYGDLAVLRDGTENSRVLRVAEAGYFAGGEGLGHIRLKLR